ncbi:MAG: PH domain-containing protein [Acidimicrobiales bacterium]
MTHRSVEDQRWRRPYPVGWFHALVGLFVALGLVFFGLLVANGISQVSAKPEAASIELVIGIAFFGIWFTFCWRLLTMGIYVGQRGLRYRSPARTTVIPWDEVKGVRLAPFKSWPDRYSLSGAVTVWIDRRNGESTQTWVNDKGADFLGRRDAFAKAFTEIERSVEQHLSTHRYP